MAYLAEESAIGGVRLELLALGCYSSKEWITTKEQDGGEMLFVGRVLQESDGYPSDFHLAAL